MKKIFILLFFLLPVERVFAQKHKTITYQLMEPNFNTKVIGGTITEVYTTKRFGKSFWWVRLGQDTILHVWPRQLDTTKMKVGSTMKFYSIKRLSSNWCKKGKI